MVDLSHDPNGGFEPLAAFMPAGLFHKPSIASTFISAWVYASLEDFLVRDWEAQFSTAGRE